MNELRMRVTRQRAATVDELIRDSVVAPTSMNEHNPTSMQPLGIVTEHREDTLAIHFVDGRYGEDTAKPLGDVLKWHDMMVVTDVGGRSRPTPREISNAARTHGSSDHTRLKSKAGLNATGIEQHFMAESLIQSKRTLMLAGNPFHTLLPGFHKDSRFLSTKRRPDLGEWSVLTQECWEWPAGQMKTKRAGKRGRGALVHFDTIIVRWEEHVEAEPNEMMCEATSAIEG
jgi:hypothetical protein